MLRVVLKLTGKVFNRDHVKLLKDYVEVIRSRYITGDKFVVVCGGGRVAREYITIARELGISEGWLDILGIEVARINALLLNALLGDIAFKNIPRSVDEFLNAWSSGRVVVMGGLQPGQSTNTVAALIAELIRADLLVNATDVDGIYDRDPKVFNDAKLLSKVSIKELTKLLANQSVVAGSYELFDQAALNVVERSRIRLFFINAFNVGNFINILNGINVGTEVIFD